MNNNNLIPVDLGQKYVIELGKMSGGNIMISGFFRIHGKLDYDRFQKAVDIVYANSDTLRMEPVVIGDQYYVRVKEEYQTKVDFKDFSSNKDNSEIYEEVKEYVLNEMKQGVNFDNNEKLINLYLYKISDTDHCFRFSIHHAFIDGVSGGILFMKIMQAYKNPDIKFPPEQSHLEFIRNMNAFYESERGDASIKFIKEELINDYKIPMFNLKEGVENATLNYNLLSIGDMIIEKKKIIPIIKKYKVSPFLISLFAYQLSAAKTLNLDDVFILFADDNRSDPLLKITIGMLATTLGMRLKINDLDVTIDELFNKYRMDFIKNRNYILYPVLKSNLFANPFAVTYQAISQKMPNIDEKLKIDYIELENPNRMYGNLFPFFGFEETDKVLIRFAFDTSLYPKEFALAFKSNMMEIIDKLSKEPDIKFKDMQLVDSSKYFNTTFMPIMMS